MERTRDMLFLGAERDGLPSRVDLVVWPFILACELQATKTAVERGCWELKMTDESRDRLNGVVCNGRGPSVADGGCKTGNFAEVLVLVTGAHPSEDGRTAVPTAVVLAARQNYDYVRMSGMNVLNERAEHLWDAVDAFVTAMYRPELDRIRHEAEQERGK